MAYENPVIRDLRVSISAHTQLYWGGPDFPGSSNRVALYHKLLGFPVALVWYQFDSDENIVIMHSYVPIEYRRLGLRREVNSLLFRSYKDAGRILTQSGTRLGKLFMRGVGCRQVGRHWEITREAWRHRHG